MKFTRFIIILSLVDYNSLEIKIIIFLLRIISGFGENGFICPQNNGIDPRTKTTEETLVESPVLHECEFEMMNSDSTSLATYPPSPSLSPLLLYRVPAKCLDLLAISVSVRSFFALDCLRMTEHSRLC
jgi:hypothetical protein